MGKPKFNETELSVCANCIQLLANGKINNGEDTAERTSAGMTRIWGDDVKHLIADGADLGYCISSCDGCGETDHGDRYRATALIPA